MAEEEEKGFVIKDRRSFDDEGTLKEEGPKEEAPKEEEKGEAVEREEPESGPLPEPNFNSLIFSLSSSALINLGEVPDPHSGQNRKDFNLAKHTIDTIAMLKEKTEGNLNEEEKKFLETILTDLRWRYVKAVE